MSDTPWEFYARRAEAALVDLRRSTAALLADVLPHIDDPDLRARVVLARQSVRHSDVGGGILAELDGARRDAETYRSDAEHARASLQALIAAVRDLATSTARVYANEECSDVPGVCDGFLSLLSEVDAAERDAYADGDPGQRVAPL